jgi:hypothetical protein
MSALDYVKDNIKFDDRVIEATRTLMKNIWLDEDIAIDAIERWLTQMHYLFYDMPRPDFMLNKEAYQWDCNDFSHGGYWSMNIEQLMLYNKISFVNLLYVYFKRYLRKVTCIANHDMIVEYVCTLYSLCDRKMFEDSIKKGYIKY